MARHPASRKGAGGGQSGAQSKVGRSASSHVPEQSVEAAPTDARSIVDDEPTRVPHDDADPEPMGEDLAAKDAVQPGGDHANDANATDAPAVLTNDAPEGDAVPVAEAVAQVADAAPVAAPVAQAVEAVGLERLIHLVQTAINEIDAALEQGSDVRISLLSLASGVPGDDRDVNGYLRRSLAPTQDRLLSVLAGLSEERRALAAASADLARIFGRHAYDAADGLAKVVESTAPFRTGPEPVVAAAAAPAPAAVAPSDDARGPSGPATQPPADDDHAEHGHGGGSAVSRLAGALRRSAGQALGVYPPADDAEGAPEAGTGETAPAAAGDEGKAAAARGQTAHAPGIVQAVWKPVSRTARYAALIGVPALMFSALGGVPPRGDAVPVPSALIAQRTVAPSGSVPPTPSAMPGVATASEIPPGDDTGPLVIATLLPNGSAGTATLDPNTPDPSAPATALPIPGNDGAVVSYRGPSTARVVALTFDDGYSPAALRKIFATLVANDVAATFFVNGIYLSRAPSVWKQIAQAGFPVGNHTYHHVDIRHLTAAQLSKELELTASTWRRITGTNLIPYFRPPYGAHSASADTIVAADGYPNIVLWSNSVADTASGTTVATGTAAALRAGPGGIVLLHVGPTLTPELLQGVIDGFRARGFSFVTIPELLGQ